MPEQGKKLLRMTDRQIMLLERMIESEANTPQNDSVPHQKQRPYQTPEVYLALTPSGGISALSGTTPGHADCQVYQVINGTAQLTSGPVKTVYNFTASAIGGSKLVTIMREKFGAWLVAQGGSSSSCDTMRFQVVSVDALTRSALVIILASPAGCSLCDLPDTLLRCTVAEVCDPQGCFFNEPNDRMIGREGWAKYMLPAVSTSCQLYPYALVPEWEVFSLCCALNDCTM